MEQPKDAKAGSLERVVRRLDWLQMENRYVGRKYRSRHRGHQETLRVVDVTLGGDPLIKARGDVTPTQAKQSWWLEWVKHAKEVA